MTGKKRDLIPTRITDKNGRRTTVHKKPEGKGWAAAAPARPPVDRSSPPKYDLPEAQRMTDNELRMIEEWEAGVSSQATPADGLSALAALAGDGHLGNVSRGAQIAERLGELWTRGSAFPEWAGDGTSGSLSDEYLSLQDGFEKLYCELDKLPDEEIVEALQHPDFPAGFIEFYALSFPEVVLKRSDVSVAHAFRKRQLYRSEVVADEDFLAAVQVLREHRMDDLKRYCEEHPEHNWYIESDSQWFVPRDGQRSTLTGDVFDLDGYDYHGKNRDGLTREEAATAAEHRIDPDLMRALIDGE